MLTVNDYKQHDHLLGEELNVKEVKFETPAIVDGDPLSVIYNLEDKCYYYAHGMTKKQAFDTEMLRRMLEQLHKN